MFTRLTTGLRPKSTTALKSILTPLAQLTPQQQQHQQQRFLSSQTTLITTSTRRPFSTWNNNTSTFRHNNTSFLSKFNFTSSQHQHVAIIATHNFLPLQASPNLFRFGAVTTPGVMMSALAMPQPVENNDDLNDVNQRPPRRRGGNRASPETQQDDVFHPSGRPPNPIPALAWEIRRDITKPEYKKVLQDAMGSNWSAKNQPKWDETDPIGSVESLIARIVHDMHRVSICIAPIAQNLSLVNSMGQMYNREKKRGIIPVFDLDRLASFQRRLVNRYKKVIELIPQDDGENKMDKETAQQRFASLQGALQLCLYDVSLMYAIDSAIAQHHPRHPKSFLQQSIKAQADYLMQRRNLIAKQIRGENPDMADDDFKAEFNKRITFDTQLMNEMLEQRRVDEQKRWAQMQRAQILRARQRRHQQLQEQKKLATGGNTEGDDMTASEGDVAA